jgi:ribosomal protein S17
MADVFLYSVPSDADVDDVRLRDPTASAVDVREGAAPVSAVAAISATGRKGASSAAPVSGVAVVTAGGLKAAESAAPISVVGVVTADGQADNPPATATPTLAGGVTDEDVERIRRFLKREKEPITKLYKKLVKVKRYVPAESKAELVKTGDQYAKPEAKPLSLDWLNFEAIMRAGDQERMKSLINNAIMAAEAARAEDDEDEDILLLLQA